MAADGQPPQDLLAEQATLGAMMLSTEALAKVVDILQPDDFYRPNHGAIFSAIVDLFSAGCPVDPTTVAIELDKRSKLTNIGGAAYLLDLIQSCPTAVSGDYYAKAVADKAVRRRLLAFGIRCQQLSYTGDDDEIGEVLAQAEKFLKEVHAPKKSTLTFSDLFDEWNAWVDEEPDVILTPWTKVNDILSGGLHKGRLYIFAGRPGQGKSVSALNIVSDACGRQMKSSIVFSLEMPKNEVMSRLLAAGANVNFQQIIRRDMRPETVERIQNYYKQNFNMRLYVEDRSNITVEQIAAQSRAINDLDMVVVDYVGLVKASDRKAKRNEAIAHVSRTLKVLAKELDVAVVLAAQLNRQSIDPKTGKARIPVLADLGESGALEADADAVLFLHRPEPDDGTVDVVVAKNRSGMTGVVPLIFYGQQARMGQHS